VYVTWHAPAPGGKDETERTVWVTHSTDEGKSFARERRATTEPTGACGCCGMRAFSDSKGRVYILYRAARELIHRDMYLLESDDRGSHFQAERLDDWQRAGCPMSTAVFTEHAGDVLAAWENREQVYFARIIPSMKPSPPIAAPGDPNGRKFPALAVNASGETILAWTDGMTWSKGGSLAWQLFDRGGQPTIAKGSAPGVPPWSLVAVFARPDGGFTILY
jgi:hypothetical protein